MRTSVVIRSVLTEGRTGSVKIMAQLFVGADPVGERKEMECTFGLEPARLDVGAAPSPTPSGTVLSGVTAP